MLSKIGQFEIQIRKLKLRKSVQLMTTFLISVCIGMDFVFAAKPPSKQASSAAQTSHDSRKKASKSRPHADKKENHKRKRAVLEMPPSEAEHWSVVGTFPYGVGPTSPGDAQTVVMIREVQMYEKTLSVATVTTSVINRKDMRVKASVSEAKAEAVKLAEFLRATVDAPQWEAYEEQGNYIFKADWPAQNRFVQMLYRNLGNRYLLSTSSTRRIYAFPIAAEANFFQQGIAGEFAKRLQTRAAKIEHQKQKTPKLLRPEVKEHVAGLAAFEILNQILDPNGFLISTAEAAQTPALPTLPPVSGAVDPTGNYAINLGNQNLISMSPQMLESLRTYLNSGGKDLNEFISKASGTINNGAQNLANTGRTFYNGVLVDTRKAADGAVDSATAKALAASKQATDYAGAKAKESIDYARDQALVVERQTNEDAKKLMDRATAFDRVFKVAFAAGAGGAAGAAVANFAIEFLQDGAMKVVSSIYHSIMGTLSDSQKDLMRKSAGQAFKDMEDSARNLTAIEIELDKRMAALNAMSGLDQERLALSLRKAIVKNSNDLTLLQNDPRLKLGGDAREQCESEQASVLQKSEGLRALRDVLVGDGDSVQGICAQMQNLLLKWQSAEAALHNARVTISNNSSAILNAMTKNFQDARKELGSERKNSNFCKENNSDIKEMGDELDVSRTCIAKTYAQHGYDRIAQGADSDYEERVRRECKTKEQLLRSRMNELMGQSCDQNQATQAARDRTQEFQNGLLLTSANLQAANTALREIARQDCDVTDRTGNCDGRAGAFSELRKRYERLYEQAAIKCPGMITKPAVFDEPLVKRQSVADKVAPPSSNRQSLASSSSTAANGSSNDGSRPGFFTRVWRGIKSFWNSVF